MDEVISITTREAKEFLLNNLELDLKKFGFKKNIKQSHLKRRHSLGFDIIGIGLLNYWPLNISINTIGITTRINKVENIVNPFIPKEYFNHEYSSTTVTILDQLKEDIQNIELVFYDDLPPAYLAVKDLIETKGLIILERNSDLQKLNKELKDRILLGQEKGWVHSISCLMQSLTLMYLCNDALFDEFSERYKAFKLPQDNREAIGKKALTDLIVYLKSGIIGK